MSEKDLIIKKANEEYIKRDTTSSHEIKKPLEDYLEKNPNDIEIWLRLAVLAVRPPTGDDCRAIECINEVLKVDPNNFEALILGAYINKYFKAEISNTLDMLNNFKTNDPKQLSMIEHAKSWSYEVLEKNKYKQSHNSSIEFFYDDSSNYPLLKDALKKSIDLYSYHVFNYKQLALLYNECNRKDDAAKLLKKAIRNIRVVYTENSDNQKDWTCAKEYLNEHVKGTHITNIVYQSIKEFLLEITQEAKKMCNKENLLNKTNKLISKYDGGDTFKIEATFENYLENHPTDIDMWLRMAVFELTSLFSYYPKSLGCINTVLDTEPSNFTAIMLLTCVDRFHAPVSHNLLDKLSSIKTDDPEKLSMIEYVKSWSYEQIEENKYSKLNGDSSEGFYKSPENYKQYESALKKSIKHYQHHINNYEFLAHLYAKCNRKKEAVELLKVAIKNANALDKENSNDKEDESSPQNYLNWLVKGTCIYASTYESLGEYLVEYSKP